MSELTLNKKNTTKDMIDGSPLKCILNFAIPMFFGMLFQQLYSMVDAAIVGRFLGTEQLAGVGATGSLCFLIIGFCNGVCSGFSIPVAQMFGAKKDSELRKFVANSVWFSIIIGSVATILTVIFCKDMLVLLQTPSDIFDYSYIYIVILFAGIPTTFLYNLAAGIIRALGDSRSPVIFLAIASILNIVLDIVFICLCDMDIEGAAIATVISQGVSGTLCIIYMKKKFEILRITKDEWKFRPGYGGKLCYIGIPMGLQYSVTAIGTLVIQSSVNVLGSIAVAGTTAAQKIGGLLSCPIEALSATMATYAGQNVGAKRFDRLTKGLVASSLCGFALSAIMFVFVLFFGKPACLLFLDADKVSAIGYAYQFLFASAATYALLTLVGTVRFSIQGMGFSAFAIIAGFLEMVARFIAGLILAPKIGYLAAAIANPLAWIFADAFLIPAFFYCKRRLKKIYG